ncbi:MAG: hypothetical protein SFV15_06970 [Polyangiaceae bacterium]|nr:hypothetical protein [Polyangiaceae bacterium]
MRPADDPEFFERPAPDGRSRESSIRLDAHGNFWHAGDRVENQRMRSAFGRWVSLHPNGRFILNNGYDWSYLSVEDTGWFVVRVRDTEGGPRLVFSDGTEQFLTESELFRLPNEALYARLHERGMNARFTREAALMLGPWLTESESGALSIQVGGQTNPIKLFTT